MVEIQSREAGVDPSLVDSIEVPLPVFNSRGDEVSFEEILESGYEEIAERRRKLLRHDKGFGVNRSSIGGQDRVRFLKHSTEGEIEFVANHLRQNKKEVLVADAQGYDHGIPFIDYDHDTENYRFGVYRFQRRFVDAVSPDPTVVVRIAAGRWGFDQEDYKSWVS